MRLCARQAALLGAIVLAGCLGGCGEEHSAGSASSVEADRAVEHELARALLAGRENVEAQPTEAEIKSLLGQNVVRAACTPRGGTRFGCVVRYRESGQRGCTATVIHGRASDLQCGSTPEPPTVSDGFVDCSSVGHARSVTDPVSDTSQNGTGPASARPHPAREPRADLTGLTVASDGASLCIDFTLAATPGSQTRLGFIAGSTKATEPPSESLSANIDLGAADGPRVTTLDHGSISARVGTSGNRVSLVIAKSALPPALHYLFNKPFEYEAHSYFGPPSGSLSDGVSDGGPNGRSWPEYR